MAMTSLPGAVCPANPSRRAFIATASLAIPVAAMAALPSISNPRSKWDRLVVEFRRADQHMNAVGVEHDAAENALHAARELLGDRPQAPHIEYSRPIHEMTVAELRDLAPPVHVQEQHAAAVAEWQVKSEAAKQITMGDIEDRWQDALSKQEAALNAVFAHPAPDAAALLFKVDLIEREYSVFDLDVTVTRHVLADVRRFVRGEA